MEILSSFVRGFHVFEFLDGIGLLAGVASEGGADEFYVSRHVSIS